MDPSGWTPLHSAAFEGHHNVCNLIMDTVVDKNPKDATGLTPLHAAAQEGHREVCKLIIDSILDKNPKSEDGTTPLHFAAQVGHKDVCKLIIDSVMDVADTLLVAPHHSVFRGCVIVILVFCVNQKE